MTEIQIINAMNKSVINKITEFKNKELKKEELNKYMFINLSYILSKTAKIKSKNEKIKKEQDIEIKKSLTNIKSYNGKFTFNSEEIENKPVMKKILNPTLELYIPLSEISYTTEIQLYNDKSGNSKFNESFLLKNNEDLYYETDNEDKDIHFEEPPINYIKFGLETDKYIYGKNNSNFVNDKFIDLINKLDEDIITEKKNNDIYDTNLFYELINSFDEGDKEDLDNNDCINLDFKKIKSSFYIDDIINRKSVKRNSYENYRNMSSISDSTSYGSNSRSYVENNAMNKEFYDNEFGNYLSFDAYKKNLKLMSIDYLRYMLVVYSNTISKSKRWFYMEQKMFLNLIKSFILKIGISSKKIYEKIFQSLSINSDKGKNEICSFENFLKSFSQILKFKEENYVLKYKFIMSLFRLGEEDINVKHINIFMQLIKGEAVYDFDLWDELNRGLVQRYDKIYPNDSGNNFKYDKMLICLESFFDKTGKK
jgi:hypothetical protein